MRDIDRQFRDLEQRLDRLARQLRQRPRLFLQWCRVTLGFRRRLRPWWQVIRRKGRRPLYTGGVLYFAFVAG